MRVEVAQAGFRRAHRRRSALVGRRAKRTTRSATRCAAASATQDELTNAIIFCNRKRDVAMLHRSLRKHGFSAGALHGDMDQRARMATLDGFRNGEIQLLVASDVAARGLDIPAVSHVFNFDVPIHAEDYVHRIGRTGRAGRSGKSFTLVTKADKKYLDAIERLIGNSIKWEGATTAELPESEADDKPRGRSGRGERKPASRRRGGDRARTGKSAGDEAPAEEPAVARAEAGELDVPVEALAEQAPDAVPAAEAKPSARKRATTSDRARPANGRGRSAPSGGNRGGRGDDGGKAPVGFGDDIPAFMLIGTGA